MPDKCRLSGSTIAGMVHRRVEPVQRRVPAGRQVATFAVKYSFLTNGK